MSKDIGKLARDLLRKELETLTQGEKLVIASLKDHLCISRNVGKESEEEFTFGQQLADKVASFGGSWVFIFLFVGILLTWVGLNSFILIQWNDAFDPYPFILLNLMLSMIAALQAPIIMMSQNRQTEKDRAYAEHDYEVNLKAELEIMALHEKVDSLRQEHFERLFDIQQEQLDMLTKLLGREHQK